jgi:hypothetical protein
MSKATTGEARGAAPSPEHPDADAPQDPGGIELVLDQEPTHFQDKGSGAL